MGRQPSVERSRKNRAVRRAIAPALILMALLLVPLGALADDTAAEEVHASILRVSLPLTFTGSALATSEEGLLHMTVAAGDTEFILRLDAATMRVDHYTILRTSTGIVEDRHGLLSRAGLGSSEEADVARYGPFTEAWLALDSTPRKTFLLAESRNAGDAVLKSEGALGAAHLDDVRQKTVLSYRNSPVGNDYSRNLHPGAFVFEAEAPKTTMEGTFRIVLHGIDFTIEHAEGHQDITTGTSTGSAYSGDPTDVQLPGTEQMTQYAILELTGAHLTILSASPQSIYAPSGALRIDIDGTMASPALAGGIRIGNDMVHTAGDAAHMSGQFTIIPTGTGDGNAGMRLEGDVDTLTVGPQQYAAKGDAVRATAGVMVILAGAGAVAWQLGKSGLVFPLYAKLTRRKVLDQGTRNLVFVKVQQDPGVTTKAIAETLDVSWSTASYHLRVLRHMGLITARRRGRHEHHFVSGERSLGEQEIMAALRHPTTHRIARLVTREPGIIQKDICARLGIAPSTASDHLRRLKDLGAVREVQDWRKRSYHPIDGLQRITGTPTEPQAPLHMIPVQTVTPTEQGA